MKNKSYVLNNDSVIWERIGKQVVIADLTTGKYCCIENESGLFVWDAIIAGLDDTNIIKSCENTYCHFDDRSAIQVAEFIDKLIDIRILKATESDNSKSEHLHQALLENTHFVEPKILIYSDLDTLLMIDPIDDDIELAPPSEDLVLR